MRIQREIQIPLVQESALMDYWSVHIAFKKYTESIAEYLKSDIGIVAGFIVAV